MFVQSSMEKFCGRMTQQQIITHRFLQDKDLTTALSCHRSVTIGLIKLTTAVITRTGQVLFIGDGPGRRKLVRLVS